MFVKKENNGFSVKAYQGDAKTLLAFNLTKAKAKNLAGFTIQVAPNGKDPFFIPNNLRFEDASKHAQDAKLTANSSFNSPIHKFRWVYVPGSLQQGTKPFLGPYVFTVTPRYFAKGSLQPFDPKLSVAVPLDVVPFVKGKLQLGFTRGFTQSQAFVHHFGLKAIFRPKGRDLVFDTKKISGKNDKGEEYTFADEYEWLGFTARDRIFDVASAVLKDKSLKLDVFAYDLNEPDLIAIFFELAKQKRIRVILDDATLHHLNPPSKKSKPKAPGAKPAKPKSPPLEDEFEKEFRAAAGKEELIKRGKFGRFSHDKVFIVSNSKGAQRVLTGSTNFSVTGLYVNSNHVLVFNDPNVAATYARIFQLAWDGDVLLKNFNKTEEAEKVFPFSVDGIGATEITFSPHLEATAKKNLDALAARIEQEPAGGSVLFAVMGLDKKGTGPVFPALRDIHKNETLFSYGVSDTPDGIFLYTPRKKTGALVSGKPTATKLPPPFDQVPNINLGHQVHHKFVVCGFNGKKPVVYCGSSNLAQEGEKVNGDNLIAIHDGDIATVFAIEALALVDHFDFLDRTSTKAKAKPAKVKMASKQQQAVAVGWFLSTSDTWVTPYYDEDDLHFVDRNLFG